MAPHPLHILVINVYTTSLLKSYLFPPLRYLWVNDYKVRKRAKIRNRYNQAPHLTQDTNGKVTTSQLDISNESQEVSLFPASDNKTSTNRRS